MRSPTFRSILLGLILLSAPPVYAQYTTASFGGSVVDSNNAVLPQSQVDRAQRGYGVHADRHDGRERRIPVPETAGRQLRAARRAAWLFQIRADRHHAHRRSGGEPDGRHAGRPGLRGGHRRSGCRAGRDTQRHARPAGRSKARGRVAPERQDGAVAGVSGRRNRGPRDATAAASAATAACTPANRPPA